MGLLIQGQWHDQWYNTDNSQGHFIREDAQFRSQIQTAPFTAETGRYHLYISHACPWAHRTMIVRQLKGLSEHISYTAVSPDMLSEGWSFEQPEPNYGYTRHHQLYTHARKDYTGRVTVPVLWDKQTETIVNNESAEIIRIFNSAFNSLTDNKVDLAPGHLKQDIEAWNKAIYSSINNGVYRCGFATRQEAYETAFQKLFSQLDVLENHLQDNLYLTGNYLTEADVRLFTTLIRFDPVYYGHFKCNLKRLQDYPALWDYTKAIYQFADIRNTVHFDHIKRHYYYSHDTINPTRIVPAGPGLSSLDEPAMRPEPILFR